MRKHLGLGLLALALSICSGCGSLGRMIPLDGDLSPEDVNYCKNLRTSWNLSVQVAGERVSGSSGNFYMGGPIPLYFGAKAISADGRSIAGAKYGFVPAIPFPFVNVFWGRGAVFGNDGRIKKRTDGFGFNPLFGYASSSMGEEKLGYAVSSLLFFGWGRGPNGWFGRFFFPFGPGSDDLYIMDAGFGAEKSGGSPFRTTEW